MVLRPSQLCQPCARPSSNSSLDCRHSDARTAENGFATSSSMTKSAKVVLGGSRQMDLRQARRVPPQCSSASNQDGKTWQLGLVPAEPAPSTRLNLSVPTRRRHPATAKDRRFHSRTQTKRILASCPRSGCDRITNANGEIVQNLRLWSTA